MAQYQLVALLAEGSFSEEDKNAKVLAKLGAIQERFLSIPISKTRAFHQGLFWVTVDKKLDQLKLDARLRNKIEADIIKTVSRPDNDWALWGVTCIPIFDPR